MKMVKITRVTPGKSAIKVDMLDLEQGDLFYIERGQSPTTEVVGLSREA